MTPDEMTHAQLKEWLKREAKDMDSVSVIPNAYQMALEYIERLEREKTELRNMLSQYRCAQSKMLEKWSEGNDEVKKGLWKNLHALEEPALDLLEKIDNAAKEAARE